MLRGAPLIFKSFIFRFKINLLIMKVEQDLDKTLNQL